MGNKQETTYVLDLFGQQGILNDLQSSLAPQVVSK